MITCDHTLIRSELHVAIVNRRDREDPWEESTPKCSFVEFPSQCASPDKLDSCDESLGCYIGNSISSCLSKFVLTKILSSLESSSVSDMLRSTFRIYTLVEKHCMQHACHIQKSHWNMNTATCMLPYLCTVI